jgi:hypothetical protein
MFRILRSILSPTRAIAAELRIIRELMEIDLASRNLFRPTQVSRRDDVEISYSGDDPNKKTRGWLSSAEEDYLRDEEDEG